jgi:hypothetical protein
MSELPSQRFRNGSMRCGDAVKDALREALKKSGLSREVVADEMSRLLGENIGTNQINNWAAPEKKDRRIPMEYVGALSVVLNDISVAQTALDPANMLALSEKQAPIYRLGEITAEEKERRKEKKEIMEAIRG